MAYIEKASASIGVYSMAYVTERMLNHFQYIKAQNLKYHHYQWYPWVQYLFKTNSIWYMIDWKHKIK